MSVIRNPDEHAQVGLVDGVALLPAGAQRMLDRLCDAAAIDAGEDFDTLRPHGARRGLWDALYDDDPRLVQDVLRR